MSQSIIISSENFNGETVNVLFKPTGSDIVVNLGELTLPSIFEPNLLSPPQNVFGDYTITVLGVSCTYYMNVPNPTPTVTPTPTPTPRPTPTPTPTMTPTPSFNPCPK